MDALIQVLGEIESTNGKKTVAPNPGSCIICNNCDGWQSERVAPKGRTYVVKKWPSPGFQIRTNIRDLVGLASGGCSTCKIFHSAIIHFLPKAEDDLEVES